MTAPTPEPVPVQPTPDPPARPMSGAVPGAPAPATAGVAAGPFDPSDVVWQPVSPRLVRVRLISLMLVAVVPVVGSVLAAWLTGLAWLWAVPAVLLGSLVWEVALVRRQVAALGYAERDDDLLIRRGVLFRSLVVVPYGRMQFVDVQAGPLDRWAGVARVQLHTASAASDAAIPGLTPAEAARLRDRLAARGEARLAGL